MRTSTIAIMCASVLLPYAAPAEMSDSEYCAALSAAYRQYIGANLASGSIPEAMAGCQTNPASSIPVLEKVLKDQKIPLPTRT